MRNEAEQLNLIDVEKDWEKEWQDMPEYNNKIVRPPLITAVFKFRSKKDFEEFNNLVKEYVYKGERVFDGIQREYIKSTWYPLLQKANKYYYDNES